jgi:hypothetical protein
MICEIQKYYKNLAEGNFFILLTHNCHFYLNVRDHPHQSYKNQSNYHLFSDGKFTTIKSIESENDDFKTNYELLWKELIFLYEQNKPDLMLNCCRKICETFIKFNRLDSNSFYGNTGSAKKLFNVNSHSIDDLESEQNGKNKNEVIGILKNLFSRNHAESHFEGYWTLESKSNEIV